MNEIDYVILEYDKMIQDLADNISNSTGCGIPKDEIRDLPYEDLRGMIQSSPQYFNLPENKRGVFVSDDILKGLSTYDKDDVVEAIAAIKESFVEQHDDILIDIIGDVENELDKEEV